MTGIYKKNNIFETQELVAYQRKHWYYLVGIPTLTNRIIYQFDTVTSVCMA